MSSTTTTDIKATFGLKKVPFTREVTVPWQSEIFADPIADLTTVIANRMSGALIAPAGTGKTNVLRALVGGLSEARYRASYLKVTSLSKRDFCRELTRAIGIESAGTYPSLVRSLQDGVEEIALAHGLRLVIVLDEAHDMRPDVLAILRILTNFDMDSRLLLSLILCGQPPLAKLLARADLLAVRQRIAHCATLRLLSRDESKSYIDHRMTEAGAQSTPFDPHSLEAVYEISRGNLRAIDHLARKSLEIAAKQGVPTVDETIVVAARKQLLS
jgi:general secretion pathway protein A